MIMRYRIVVILLLVELLSGCVAAVVAGAAAGGIVVYDRRSIMVMESDISIFHRINTAILTDPRFHNSRIVIISFNHVVLLLGQTPTSSLRPIAEAIAQRQANVRRVYNEISISNPISFRDRTHDTWVTSQVRSGMLTKKGLESGSIHIVTEKNIVYLMGIVTQEQANLAASVARQIQGVQKVVKVFQYY
jgi:osmotically-inducible protein OsmY